MTIFLGLLVIVFFLVSWLMPWFQRSSIKSLEFELSQLKKRLVMLEQGRSVAPTTQAAPVSAPVFQSTPEMMVERPPERVPPVAAAPAANMTFIDESDDYDDVVIGEPSPVKESKPKPAFNFEQQFGARLPVWVGGISLALAGFYMVKYSIDNNLVSPSVRVMLGLIMGLGFIGAGHWLFKRPGIANAARICQSLTGAGLVCLYGAFFAASSLYELISPTVGFAGMLGVTALAVVLSVSQGAAVAVFGLIGGFMTPILIGSKEPNTLLLFLYLSGLSMSLLYLARRQNWQWLAIPVYALSLLWALGWVAGAWLAVDAIWVSIYLLVLMLASPFVLFRSGDDSKTEPAQVPRYASLLGSFGSLIILSVITARAEFSSLHWSMFGLAGLASIALAVFKPRLYYFAPAAAAGATAFLLFSWSAPEPVSFFKVAGLFAAVYFIAGCSFMFRTPYPAWWSKLAILSLPVLYVIGYLKHEHAFDASSLVLPFWAWAAIGVSFTAVSLTASMQKKFSPDFVHKDKLVALSALIGLSFLSWALYLSIGEDYLMLAYALQVTAIAWLMQRFSYPFIGYALKAALALFALALLRYGVPLIQLLVTRDFIGPEPQSFPLLPLTASAALLLCAGSLKIPAVWKKVFLITGGALGAALLFGAIQIASGTDQLALLPDFYIRVLTLNLTWLLALGTLYAGMKYGKAGLSSLSWALICYASFETVIVDLFMNFPPRGTSLGDIPLLNLLIPAFALPACYFYIVLQNLDRERAAKLAKPISIAALFYVLLFVTLEVSHFYHAPFLSGGERSLAEIYTYSVVWLLSGIGMLLAGTLNRSRLLRVGSLVVIIGTVCKVFLYDASELDGILRVLSFLGLGLSLLGLSFFYTRFVFGRSDKP